MQIVPLGERGSLSCCIFVRKKLSNHWPACADAFAMSAFIPLRSPELQPVDAAAGQAPSLKGRLAVLRANEATSQPGSQTIAGPAAAGNSNQSSICTPDVVPTLKSPAAVVLNADAEAHMLAILGAPLQPGESAHVGNLRKEHELAAVLATISVGEARTLHQRLSRPPAAPDLLATKFSTLIHERRQRLLAFIADTRRRLTIAQSRAR